MHKVSATDLARNTREILDKVSGGDEIAIERNRTLIARIIPLQRNLTAAQALSGLPLPMRTATQALTWLGESKEDFDDAVRDPWA